MKVENYFTENRKWRPEDKQAKNLKLFDYWDMLDFAESYHKYKLRENRNKIRKNWEKNNSKITDESI